MPQIHFIQVNGLFKTIDPVGLSVMEIAVKHMDKIEGVAGGSLACATCHVYASILDWWTDARRG